MSLSTAGPASSITRRLPGFPRSASARMTGAPLVLAAGGAGLVLAYILVRRSPTQAVGLVLIGPALWVLTRRYFGITVGLALLLMLPSWHSLGSSQASVLRVASLAAASTLLLSRQRLRLCATDCALLLLVVVIVLGWLLQYDVPHSGRVLSVELTPLGFYLGARALPHERVRTLMTITLGAGTIGALTVILEYVIGHTLFLDPATYQWSATSETIFRPGGIFGGPPQASTMLCFVIVFGLGGRAHLRGRRRLIASACLVICALALVLTFTRAAFLGIGIAVLAYLWLTRSPLLRPIRVAWVAGVCITLALAVVPALQRSFTIQKGIFRSGTLSAREGYWTTALPIATSSAHNFVFGIGTAALETPAVSVAAPIPVSLAARPSAYQTSLHSQYVTQLVEEGIVGIAALMFFLLVPFARITRAARSTRRPEYAAIAAAIVALLIVMSVDTVLLDGPSFAMVMIMAGIAATASRSRAREPLGALPTL